MRPNDGLDQLLPVTAPGDEEHEASRPNQVSEEEHPSPDRQVVHAIGGVTVNQRCRVGPQIIAEPAHQVGGGLVELSNVAAPDCQVLPVPVEGQPAQGVQHPEHRQVEGVPCGDIAGTATTGAVAREAVAEVLLVGHQLGTTCVESAFHQHQSGGVQAQCDRVVNQEVARSDGQEQAVVASVDRIGPTFQPGSAGVSDGIRVSEQQIHAVDGFALSGLDELREDRFDQDLLLGGAERNANVVMNVQTQGVEAQEQGNPAQVRDDRFFVLQHAIEHVAFVLLGVVIANEEDRTVSERTNHQETSDVLVVGVERSLGGVVLSDEDVRGQRVHVLGNQRGYDA